MPKVRFEPIVCWRHNWSLSWIINFVRVGVWVPEGITKLIKAPQIKTFKEVYRYDAMSFIGDAGGIIGLFLGFSILSIYEELIKPLLHKISKQISSSK